MTRQRCTSVRCLIPRKGDTARRFAGEFRPFRARRRAHPYDTVDACAPLECEPLAVADGVVREVEPNVSWNLARWSRRNRVWRSYRVAVLLFRTIWVMYWERSHVMRARAKGDLDAQPDIKALTGVLRDFRVTAVSLGGLLIKLGQFLSSRADLLPAEALAELVQLQDEVPAERFDDVRRVIEHELKAPIGTLFAGISHAPAGSASLGQVHKAILKDGRVVAIKVQRPDIRSIVRTDLATLRFVISVLRRVAPGASQTMDLPGLYREFSRMVFSELDYIREGRNAERFAQSFANDPSITMPGVVWGYTTHRVLTLEWVSGIKITNLHALEEAGLDKAAIARRLVSVYFKQVLELGVFHADPHPGNIFVQQTGQDFRLVFVDFGMMGRMTARMRSRLRDCFIGLVQQDAVAIVHALDSLGFVGERANHEALEQAISMMLMQYSSMSLGQLRSVDPGEMLDDIETLLYNQPFHLPSEFAFLGRAMAMLVGLATHLSPEFNFLEVATPYARTFTFGSGLAGALRLVGVDSVEQLGRDLVREGVSIAKSLSALPLSLERVLTHAERGDLRLIIESPTLNPQLRRRSRFVPTSMLRRPVPAWIPLGIVGAYLLGVFMRRRGPGA